MLLPPQPQLSRFKPSLAESLLRPQVNKAPSVFVQHPTPFTPSESRLEDQLQSKPSPQINFVALTLAASIAKLMDHHDHSTMDHSTMDHSAMNHGVDSTDMRRCHMNMIFNWDATGTCIVFRRFYVSGTASLVMYMILLFLLALGYEYMRLATTRFDSMTRIKLGSEPKRQAKRSPSEPSARRSPASSTENLVDLGKAWGKVAVPKHIQLTRSLFYVANIAVSFFLMLVVMTYNAQIIAAVLAGAFVGHFLFHRELNYEDGGKGMACH